MGMFLRRHAEEVEAKLAAAKNEVVTEEKTTVEKAEGKAKSAAKAVKAAVESELGKLEAVVDAVEAAV